MPLTVEVPFRYEAEIVLPRHRNSTTVRVRGSRTVVLEDREKEHAAPVVSCATDLGRVEWFMLGGRTCRFLRAPSGGEIEPEDFAAAVTHPGTDWQGWADYPFPRATDWVHVPPNGQTETVRISRGSPWRNASKTATEHRQWIRDDSETEADRCAVAATGLFVAGDRIASAETLPRIFLDVSVAGVLRIDVRTTREHFEREMVRKHTKRDPLARPAPEDLPSFPLQASELLLSLLDGIAGPVEAEPLRSVAWRVPPALDDAAIGDVRETCTGLLADFRKRIGGLAMNRIGLAAMRLAVDFAGIHDAFLEDKAKLGDAALAATACLRALDARPTERWEAPLAAPWEAFFLKVAVAVDVLAPEPVLTEDERAVYAALSI